MASGLNERAVVFCAFAASALHKERCDVQVAVYCNGPRSTRGLKFRSVRWPAPTKRKECSSPECPQLRPLPRSPITHHHGCAAMAPKLTWQAEKDAVEAVDMLSMDENVQEVTGSQPWVFVFGQYMRRPFDFAPPPPEPEGGLHRFGEREISGNRRRLFRSSKHSLAFVGCVYRRPQTW